MIPTFLDLRTGKIAKSTFDNSFFWWAEGDGACDCNRAPAFAGVTDPTWREGCCYGCKRFVAIDVEGELVDEDWDSSKISVTKEQVLRAMNAGYCR